MHIPGSAFILITACIGIIVCIAAVVILRACGVSWARIFWFLCPERPWYIKLLGVILYAAMLPGFGLAGIYLLVNLSSHWG